jgi:lipopolysaccharide transport system permease protein
MNRAGATLEPPAATGPEASASGLVTIIQPRRGWRSLDLRDLWRCRQLLYFLTWRDVKVRYKQTILGAAWAILQPLTTMIVFTLFLGRLASVPSGGLPYPLFVYSGLLPWIFFANAISGAGQSVVGNERLVTKIYFPRLIIPVSAVGAGLVDFAIASALLAVLMPCYGIRPTIGILLVPVIVAGLVLAAVGVGSLLAALNVAYRDVRHVIPFLVQTWMFATPTVYMQPDRVLSPRWKALLDLNPAYSLIANFRAALLGTPLDLGSLGVSLGVAVGLFIAGVLYFRRVESGFADII